MSEGNDAVGISFDPADTQNVENLKTKTGISNGFLIFGKITPALSSQTEMQGKTIYFYKCSSDVRVVDLKTMSVIVSSSFDMSEDTKVGNTIERNAREKSSEKACILLADGLWTNLKKVLEESK